VEVGSVTAGALDVLRETSVFEEPVAAEVERLLRRYVVMTDAQAAVVTLFVLHTHTADAAEATPYLAVTSAEKQSGKTRLLEVLELVVARPLRAAGATQAALFRSLESVPCLLFDEIDTVFGPKARQ
jgi:hypothetical protein